MGLYNPILGDIPQPDKNSKEVAFILPKSNYGALEVTQQLNTSAIYTLERTAGGDVVTTSTTTTASMILKQIFISRSYINASVDESLNYLEVYINGVKILSFNEYIPRGATITQYVNKDFFLPIENWLIPSNSNLKIISNADKVDDIDINISFIGYSNPKL